MFNVNGALDYVNINIPADRGKHDGTNTPKILTIFRDGTHYLEEDK